MTSESVRHDEFLRLFVEHQRSIYGYIYTMVTNHADAEDLLSDTSLTLWEKFGDFRPGTNFVAWACQIARFKVLNHLRAKSTRGHSLSEEILEKLSDTRLSQSQATPRRREALTGCLQRLSAVDLRLVKVCYGTSASIKQAAESIGRTAESAYKSLHRIRKALLECIERRLRAEEAGA